MAKIIALCQALVDEHFDLDQRPIADRENLMPNPIVDRKGRVIKQPASVLPDYVVARINELSFEFMKYPENIATLGMKYYGPQVNNGE